MLTLTDAVRLRPAPVYDPPFDDESPPEWRGAAALQPLLELPLAELPELTLPPATERQPDRPAWRPVPSQPGASPATTAAATRFVNTCLEILNGYRAVNHARVIAHPLAATGVLAEFARAVRRLRRASPGGRALVKVRRLRIYEPRPRVAEVTLVVGRTTGAGPDTWAFAFRLEQTHGRWLCTAAHYLSGGLAGSRPDPPRADLDGG
ncbi:MAG TPA: Rv3235 family protein [Natronosporangium sp.]